MPSKADGHIVILGPMGSGKTTLGRLLAAELGMPFSDSDEWIVDHLGRSGREIAFSDGVEALHIIEAAALDAALAAKSPAVIAAAASVVDRARSRRMLTSSFCVYLTASPEILAQRVAPATHRREVGEAEDLGGRAPLFGEVADMVVDTGLIGEQAVLDEVLSAVGKTKTQRS